MDATATMRPLLCAATYRTLIGLVAVTGMRPGEAARLDVDDVDLTSGIIVVHGKGGKTRLNLLHPSTVAALADYARQRDQAFPWRTGQSFFVSTRGTRLSVKRIDKTFARLAARADLARPAPIGHPAPMSLRHSFAVTTLISWYADDVDVDANMPVLSTWLGHTDPASTYYYLQAVPELLQAVSDKMTRPAGAPRKDQP